MNMAADVHIRLIELVPLLELDSDSQLKIRQIRNEDSVRKAMYTDHLIGVNEHLGWINRLKQDDKQIVFAVVEKGRGPLGVVSLADIDRLHKKADWAYYLAATERGGLGSAVEFAFISFVFESLGIEKLNCEVIEGNCAVVKLHKRFMFKEEGFRESNIVKNGNRIGVHFLGLTKKTWEEGKGTIYEKHASVFAKFTISIAWTDPQRTDAKNVLDQIEAARAKNNLNWMSILRIALEKSPENAKAVVGEIKKLDQEISALTQKLVLD
jgi:UDP-4-amino-4,6-dideoxy-N-acetyl-beta-L-altrosamine N-acetyltransferase